MTIGTFLAAVLSPPYISLVFLSHFTILSTSKPIWRSTIFSYFVVLGSTYVRLFDTKVRFFGFFGPKCLNPLTLLIFSHF